jgi:hypothetical protein
MYSTIATLKRTPARYYNSAGIMDVTKTEFQEYIGKK